MKRKRKTLKQLPTPKSDRSAAAFVANADLTEYDLSSMQPMRFEFSRKEARINMRLPSELLAAVKRAAEERGVPYQRFVRQALERAIAGRER
jgi:predicted DNA binding CopG/RHH family protein